MRSERMRVYQAAEKLIQEIEQLLAIARAQRPNAADHLERSADSVLFNTAEGIGTFKPKAKIAVYEIARKEANEVKAVLRKLMIAGVLTHDQTENAFEL